MLLRNPLHKMIIVVLVCCSRERQARRWNWCQNRVMTRSPATRSMPKSLNIFWTTSTSLGKQGRVQTSALCWKGAAWRCIQQPLPSWRTWSRCPWWPQRSPLRISQWCLRIRTRFVTTFWGTVKCTQRSVLWAEHWSNMFSDMKPEIGKLIWVLAPRRKTKQTTTTPHTK